MCVCVCVCGRGDIDMAASSLGVRIGMHYTVN